MLANFLTILRITKQSLSRVLSGLMSDGFVVQKTKQHRPPAEVAVFNRKGCGLESRLTAVQARRFAAAYRDTGAGAVDGFQQVLRGLLDVDTITQFTWRRQIEDS